MRLVGKLKEKVEKAETKEQAKELIANAGMELTDEEMAHVSGGDGSALMQAMAIQDMIINFSPKISKEDMRAAIEQQMIEEINALNKEQGLS